MREFFGFGGYTRPAEGFMSWQHLTFVTSLIVVLAVLAVFSANATGIKLSGKNFAP